MDLRRRSASDLLRDNCSRLYDAHRDLLRGRRAAAQAMGIGEATWNRILTGEADVRVGSIDAVAQHFHMGAWQLLVPDMDPLHPPSLLDVSPSAADVARRFETAPDNIKAAVLAVLASYKP